MTSSQESPQTQLPLSFPWSQTNSSAPTQTQRQGQPHILRTLLRRELGEGKGVTPTSPTPSQIVDDRIRTSKGDFYRKNLHAHFGCINAVEFSSDGSLLASGGDDRRILLWNVHKALVGSQTSQAPVTMQGEHLSNVFALAFDTSKTKIISAGNDDQVIIHDIITGTPLDVFVQEQPVYGVSADPINSNIFSTACDDGQLLIYDMRASSEPFCLAKLHSSFHSVMFHPTEPRFILSANTKEGAALWDVRMPKKSVLKYGRQSGEQCCMNARFNQSGNQVLALRRRRPPILYSTHSTSHLFQFNHSSYYNSCTMKSCCFGGANDQFVISGSDNFDIHVWEIPSDGTSQWVNEAKLILKGHRSIVNQVRYNYPYHIVASSGVEKIIKLWSPFVLPDESCWENDEPGLMSETARKIHSHEEYIRLVMRSGHTHFSHAAADLGSRSTSEDSGMLAFFDALVQRDITGLSDDDSGEDSTYTNTVYSTESSSEENHMSVSSPSPSLNSTPNSQLLPLPLSSIRNQNQSPSQIHSLNSDDDITEDEGDAETETGPPPISNSGTGLLDFDELPILDSSSDEDSVASDSEANHDILLGTNIARQETIRRAVLEEFRMEFAEEGPIDVENSSLATATAEPNTLTNMIARKGNLLRRLANDSENDNNRERDKPKPNKATTTTSKFSRSAAAKRTLRELDQRERERASTSDNDNDVDRNTSTNVDAEAEPDANSISNANESHSRSPIDDLYHSCSRRKNQAGSQSQSQSRRRLDFGSGSPVRMRERRRSTHLQITPVYESSNNSHSYENPPGPGPSYQYQQISDLMTMTRNQLQRRHDSKSGSSSSSSSSSTTSLSSSDSDSDNESPRKKLNSKPVKITTTTPTFPGSSSNVGMKMRRLTDSSTSSSEVSESSKNKNHLRKRKRRVRISRSRLGLKKLKLSNSTSSESNSKSKSKLGTPSDSGIEMCKAETEVEVIPCCSKSISSSKAKTNLKNSSPIENEFTESAESSKLKEKKICENLDSD